MRDLLETWQSWLIIIIVATQLLIPLHYYTVRRDEHDERFSWRMFSPMRMTKCTVRATLDGAPLALNGEFHNVWVAMARRPRFVIVEEMAAHLCEKYGQKPVVFDLECKYVGRAPRAFGGTDMCKVPHL